MRDYSDLRFLIIRRFGNLSNFCKVNGLNLQSLSHLLSSGGNMSIDRIEKMANLLEIDKADYGNYFFREKCIENDANTKGIVDSVEG